MQTLFFSVKRVHWRWQKRAQRVLRECGVALTPARFTLMRAVCTYEHGITRFNLAKLLGVAAAGVSRMVGALEALGLLARARGERDGRVVIVRATDAGRAVVEGALAAVNTESDRIARVCFAASAHPEVELEVALRFLLRARVRLLDPTPFPVPWHGGDLWGYAFDAGPHVLGEPPPFEVVAA
jgi:DNA-binding MarR family transcriptional regulator